MAINKFIAALFLLSLPSGWLLGQDRYMVFFKDKTGTPYSVSQPEQFLSQKSITRRTNQGIPVVEQDLPVNPAYIAEVKATGATIKYSSKWFNAILMEATSVQKNLVTDLPNVLSVEYVAPGKTGTGGRARTNSKFDGTTSEGQSQNQNEMLDLDVMHKDEITGEGVTIAVLDTGFPGVLSNPAFTEIIQSGRILDSYNFAFGKSNAFISDQHGAQVFSIIAGKLSNFTGGAYGANFLLYPTEYDPTEYKVEEYNWAFAAERADSIGADIISSSLGYTDFDDPSMDYSIADLDGETTVSSRAANFAFQRGMVVVSSAGNFGSTAWHFIGSPADSENVIAVGSIDNEYNHSFFSSFGPTADGRIKPDVVALGTGVASVASNGTISFGSGTSFSCPLVTSLVAGIWQKWPELTAVEILGLIKKAGSQYFYPDNTYGYGVPTYQAIKNIQEIPADENAVAVYPNPVEEDVLYISVTPADGSTISVTIQNPMGQLIKKASYVSNWGSVPAAQDVSDLAPGIYFLRVYSGNSVKTFRVVRK